MRHLSTLLLCLALSACPTSEGALDDDDVVDDDDVIDDDDSGLDDDDVAPDDDDSGPDDDDVAPDDDDVVPLLGRCGDPRPDGAPQPPPLPAFTGGTCPAIVPGMNALVSGGVDREFMVVLPSDHDPLVEVLPVLLMWHHLGGDANSLLTHGQVQTAVDERRFVAVIPEKTGDLTVGFGEYEFDPAWPYLTINDEAVMEAEAVFFDDMLACVADQIPIDEDCVSSLGVSAGALWTGQLMQMRSDRLSSAILLSGGVGPATGVAFVDVRGWTGVERTLPALVLWGGPSDYLGVDFQVASQNLEAELGAGGHFVQECVHNCGHGVPPVDPDVGLGVLYGFALDHPFWVTGGRSIYEVDGLPADTPEWCAVGIGQAVIREGSCDPEDGIE